MAGTLLEVGVAVHSVVSREGPSLDAGCSMRIVGETAPGLGTSLVAVGGQRHGREGGCKVVCQGGRKKGVGGVVFPAGGAYSLVA